MQNCYEFCFGIAKCIYEFFIFLSCRTSPLIEEAPKHTEFYKNGVKYCKMCDLDDFVNPPSPPLEKVEPNLPLEKVEPNLPLEKVEPNFCTTFQKSGKVEPNFCTTFQKSGKVEPNFDFVFSPPFPPFYNPLFNKNTIHH